jgi:hypothetical protein
MLAKKVETIRKKLIAGFSQETRELYPKKRGDYKARYMNPQAACYHKKNTDNEES